MAAPTPEAIENARRKVEQAKARLQALAARAATLNRKQDARRKIILGGLLLAAALHAPAWASQLGSASCRASVCKFVSLSLVPVPIKKTTITPVNSHHNHTRNYQ